MKDINLKKIENILNMTPDDRYLYFIRKITDFEEIWGLYNNGWAMAENNLNQQIIPFWPERDFAELCKTDIWQSYSSKSINLSDFMNKWLPGMNVDGKMAGVFYTPKDNGIVTTPVKILNDINDELEQY